MRTYDLDSGPNLPVGDVDVFRWDGYEGASGLPFQAMWYRVPAGGIGPADRHPEAELSIVVSGVASVRVDGAEPVEVGPGGAFLLDAGETHVVANVSADEPLVVFSAYWMVPAALHSAAVRHG
jgi:mannose-6-phosphate isomerase-like protein (cupin superfamily)